MKKQLAIIGCGLLLSLGAITTACTESEVSKNPESPYVMVINKSYKLAYIEHASKNLEEGNKHFALWYLDNRILDRDEELKSNVTLDQIVAATEEAVDKYAEDKEFRTALLGLAETIYEEEKKEIATDKLMDMLIDLTENLEKRGYDYAGESYSLWAIYNISLNKTESIEKTHKELRDYYKEGEGGWSFRVIKILLREIESSLPKGDSDLIKKIKSYN